MEKNKTGKYLKYAFGEILLVVIGILIALQINNWNEAKKIRKTELKLLIELKQDLLETREDLLTDIEKSKLLLITTDNLYQSVMDGNWGQAVITLDYIYETPRLFPKLSAYKSIQAYGVNIISNDSLRNEITNFFELHLERVKYSESLIIDINENEIKPFLDDNAATINHCDDCKSLFQLYDNDEIGKKELYHVHEENTKIIHLLKEKFGLVRGLLNTRYVDTENQIKRLIILIDKELDVSIND